MFTSCTILSRPVRLVTALAAGLWLATALTVGQDHANGVREFAATLAGNGVAGGVVASEAVMSRKGELPLRVTSNQQAYRQALPNTLGDFNRDHRAFRASERAGLVHVTPTSSPELVSQLLAREVRIDRAEDVMVADAVFKTLVGSLRGAPVSMIGGAGIMPGPGCRLNQSVRLTKGSTTVADFLDGVVRQAGVVWLLTYNPEEPDQALKIGFVCPDGVTLKMRIEQ